MVVPAHAWYYQQPKQWLSNSFSWFNLGNSNSVFKTTSVGGGLFVCIFRFPPVLTARIQELAETVTKRHQLTAAVQETDGTKKDAETACAREVCRQLDALGLLHRKKPAWPGWLPQTGGGGGGGSGGAQATHRRAVKKPASLDAQNIGAILAKTRLTEDEVGWLQLQWYGSQPKQWFSNSHQIFRWQLPKFSYENQTVATPAHRCSVPLPAAVAQRIHSRGPCAAIGRNKKEAEALCALKGCWLLDQAGFLARNNGRSQSKPEHRVLPPHPFEMLLAADFPLEMLNSALDDMDEEWRTRHRFRRLGMADSSDDSDGSSSDDSESESSSDSDAVNRKRKRKERKKHRKKEKKHKKHSKKHKKEKKSKHKKSSKRHKSTKDHDDAATAGAAGELELSLAMPGAGPGPDEAAADGEKREAALRQQMLAATSVVGVGAGASAVQLRFLERKEKIGSLTEVQAEALRGLRAGLPPSRSQPPQQALQRAPQKPPQQSSQAPQQQQQQRRRAPDRSTPAMRAHRATLPVHAHRTEILQSIANNRVLVLSGPTGSGKTTQLPQFLLEDAEEQGKPCVIAVTQPRRLACIAVADRIAVERGEGRVGKSVGYTIRLESVTPSEKNQVVLCTGGVLLRQLMGARTRALASGEMDALKKEGQQQRDGLDHLTHLILDEVHERDLHSDFLLTIVRELLVDQRPLKVILMSATINTELFVSYFKAVTPACDHLSVPGRMYPVKTVFLNDMLVVPELAAHASEAIVQCTQRGRDGEDNRGGGAMPLQLIAELVDYLHSSRIGADNGSGAILVFLPGWSEISAVLRSLEGRRSMQGSTLVIPLHGNLQGSTQRQVFERPRAGIRKIILSTNIAETSLTIDDVTFVIDSARKKEKGYDASTRMASLLPVWVSRDSLQQRRGRAGRVARGVCFHLLTSEQEAQLAQHDVPEMLRTPLEELCLATIQLKLGKVKSVLARTPEPPERAAVTDAMGTLRRLGALRDGTESLTALGRHLAALSTEPRFGKLLLLGSMMGCVDPLLTIVSCLANRDPFITVPQDKRREADVAKLQLAQSEEALRSSDHLLLLAVSEKYDAISRRRGDRAAGDWCREQFISQSALQMASRLRSQFSDQLGRCGFESMRGRGSGGGASASDRQKQMDLVRALIGVVLTPDIVWAVPAGDGRSPPCYDRLNNEIALAAGSVALHADPSGSSNGGGGGKPAAMFLVYGDQIKTERAVRRSSLTSVPPLALLLLGTEPPVLRPDPDATGGKGLLVTSATCPALRFRLPSAKGALLLEELRSAWLCMVDAVRKTPLFAPFIYINDNFTKTGSGQT